MATATTSLDLPYRPCVGIMLINGDGLVWVGRRLPKWQGDRSAYIWQMPQGGITAGESAEAAALRELEEETAVRSVEVLAEAPGWLSYDLPNELLGIALKGRYRGQKQKWFAMRFTGEDSDIDISAAPRPQGRVRRLALGASGRDPAADRALQAARSIWTSCGRSGGFWAERSRIRHSFSDNLEDYDL